MLGSLISAPASKTYKGHYSEFPCLKRFFQLEHGTTTVEAVCSVSGTKLLSMPWTSTGPFSGYMQVPNESDYPVGHHNVDLAAGSWPQPGDKPSIWFICGKFADRFSFGFGDSTPNNIEIVFSQSAPGVDQFVFAAMKPNGVPSINVPNYAEGRYTPSSLDSSKTSILGLIVNGRTDLTLFYTDTNGEYQSVTEPYTEGRPAFNPPATYSMGRDVVTSANPEGIVDMTAIGVFVFDELPTDISEAMEWHRTEWEAGRKRIWSNWRGK